MTEEQKWGMESCLSTNRRGEGGSILFETRAEGHYFGSVIETARGTISKRQVAPRNPRIDPSFQKRATDVN